MSLPKKLEDKLKGLEVVSEELRVEREGLRQRVAHAVLHELPINKVLGILRLLNDDRHEKCSVTS